MPGKWSASPNGSRRRGCSRSTGATLESASVRALRETGGGHQPMMAVLRLVALLGLGTVAGCALAWLYTREPHWLLRARRALQVTIVVAFVFFAVVIVERLQAGG